MTMQHQISPRPTRHILGVDVAALDQAEAAGVIASCINQRRFTKIGFLNAHVANFAQSDEQFREILAGFLILPDGVGVDIASRALFGEKFPANLNGTDFVPYLLRSITMPLKVGLVGAARDNADAAADRLNRLAPQHDYQVISDGFFTPQTEPELLARLRRERPDILLVAMGVPRQEYWIDGLDSSCATVPIAVGALFDFLSGAIPRAPLWMRQARLEWLFRLIIEPSRLWRRYVVGNPLFILRLLRQMASRRDRPS